MCKSPLYAVRKKITVNNPNGQWLDIYENGHRISRFFSQGEVVPFWSEFDFRRKRNLDFLKSPSQADIDYFDNSSDYDLLRLRCGQCIHCRLQYSKEWAVRIVCESLTSQQNGYDNLFVTLTYDDDHLHHSLKYPNLSTIDYFDLNKFIKRFREYLFRRYGVRSLRYYACGEYGDRSQRAHFHVCFFGLPKDFVALNKPYSTSFQGDIYYINDDLTSIWGNGYVICGDLNFQSAAYVARYVCKKLNGENAKQLDVLGISNQESRMSLKPGIGSAFFESFRDEIYLNDEIFLPSFGKVGIPRYFDKLYEFDDPDFISLLKVKRSVSAKYYLDSKLSHTDKEELEYLQTELKSLESRVKALIRPSV